MNTLTYADVAPGLRTDDRPVVWDRSFGVFRARTESAVVGRLRPARQLGGNYLLTVWDYASPDYIRRLKQVPADRFLGDRDVSNQSRTRSVRCLSDCRMEGCPGHRLTLAYHGTSDTVSVQFDTGHYVTYDRGVWRALVNMDAEMRDPADDVLAVAREEDARLERAARDLANDGWIEGLDVNARFDEYRAFVNALKQALRGDPVSPGAGRGRPR